MALFLNVCARVVVCTIAVVSSLDYICICVGLDGTLTRNVNNFVSFSLQLYS